jgi:hypothetical protein
MGVLSQIRTREDLEYLASDLEELRVNMYKAGSSGNPPALIKADFDSTSDKGEFLETLRKQIMSARVLEITIATCLSEQSLSRISVWVKEHFGENVVLNVLVDKTILAGAKISFNGKHKDCSLKEQLKEAVAGITF